MNISTKRSLAIYFLLVLMINSCQWQTPFKVEKGVSKILNDFRNQQISDVEYDLFFNIPAKRTENIAGSMTCRFTLLDISKPVVFDFSDSLQKIKQILLNGEVIKSRYTDGHIIIPKKLLSPGEHSVEIDFTAGNLSLNRNDEYLYTLFVPDRASSAFPCFDQPNMKATFSLSLEIPAEWIAVANGALKSKNTEGNRTIYNFQKTEPISTYLFAFTAGKFTAVERERNGRTITLYHREPDQKRIDQNLDEIFRLQFDALDWMEDYTQIEYPFGKYDLVAIPSFQYSGMEHPGAVLYRAEKLFLDPTATKEQILNRASLIAHETAHMWFGDLVTMAWFDDVWMKEVFANFMAAKAINPAFPDVDHKLAFLIDHYPKAYAIDRTDGANPIKQELGNMNMAGTLYGSIIYHKAPIIMQHLENIAGEENLKAGLREYLETFAFANADWTDLIAILDKLTETDLKSWSDIWVNEPGMPVYKTTMENNTLIVLQLPQSGNIWHQYLNVLSIYGDQIHDTSVFHEGFPIEFSKVITPDLVLLNGNIDEYGYFELTQNDLNFLMSDQFFTLDVRQRSAAYISLWENMLNGNIAREKFADAFKAYLFNEDNEQAINLLLSYYPEFFWRYNDEFQRANLAEIFEPLLWEKILQTSNTSLKSAYYKAFVNTAFTIDAIGKMNALWKDELKVEGFELSVDDLTDLSFEIAVRAEYFEPENGIDHLLESQLSYLDNPDKKKRMAFIMPALSSDETVRDAFFESLRDPANREHEPWVLTALKYLHHPVRAESAGKCILLSLNMLQEIQLTGDIFFPKGWLDGTFYGHRSQEAQNEIVSFLNKNTELDPKLRQKVLQSADPIFRTVRLSKK